jgi:hypothetical protein
MDSYFLGLLLKAQLLLSLLLKGRPGEPMKKAAEIKVGF